MVARRSAAHRGRDQRAAKLEAIPRPDRLGTAREPRRVQGAEEEIARLVSREHASGAVASVRRGGEADEEDPGAGIAEGRERPRPVPLPPEAERRMPRGLFPPRDQARAAAAGDDLALDPLEGRFDPRFRALNSGFRQPPWFRYFRA